MIYKKFKVNLILRVILLALTIFLFNYLLFNTQLYITNFIVGVIIIFQVWFIIKYVEQTNRDLERFFQSIKHSDFSQSFKKTGHGSWYDELNDAFSEVIEKFRKTRSEKEEHYRYLQTVVEHIGIGLISFKDDGEVELFNNAAKRLLRTKTLKNIKTLRKISKSLVDTLFELRSGDRKVVKVEMTNEIMQLAVFATEFKLRGYKFTLVSLQNIQSELEEQEMEAWQKLIRVLTHEIMNSVTPISSLAATTDQMIADSISFVGEKTKEIELEDLQDIHGALQTIHKRSDGLIKFVNAYRNLTIIPQPNFQIFKISDIFSRIKQLMQSEFDEKNIILELNVDPESLELTADTELIEQVLINLLINAIHAVDGKADSKIEMTASVDDFGKIVIKVIDNGTGISHETLERIFIPFFTTKKKGSGIGLSLSRQIMRMHKGTINVSSKIDQGTIFTLRF